MFRHVVVFRWAGGTSDADIDALRAGLGGLPAVIAELRDYQFGLDATMVDGNWDFAVVADFDDEAGWRAYLDHPDHRRIVEEHVRPILGERAAVQFTFEQ